MNRTDYINALEEIKRNVPEEYRDAAVQDLRNEFMDGVDHYIKADALTEIITAACRDTIHQYASTDMNLYEAIEECIIDLHVKKEEVWDDLLNRRAEVKCNTPAEEK